MKLGRLFEIESSILKYRVPPHFGLPIHLKEGQHLPKAHEIKVRCYWELFGGTYLGTWELFALTPFTSRKKKKLHLPLFS